MSVLWHQLDLCSQFESELWDTMDWARKWLADFYAEIIRLVLFDRSNNSDAIDENMY